jgi:hypothetical protein
MSHRGNKVFCETVIIDDTFPTLHFGPPENFYARLGAAPGFGLVIQTANNIAARFFVSDGGDTTVTRNLTVRRQLYANTVISTGQIRSVGPTGSRIAFTHGTDGDFDFDVSLTPFCYMNDSYNNTLHVVNANFGDKLYLQLEGSGTLTLGPDFSTSNSRTITKGNTMLSFIYDSLHMVELTRSTY